MNTTTEQLIRDAATGSSEGRLHFGQVIGLMIQAGVESYVADYRTGQTTYYLADDDTLRIDAGHGAAPDVAIAKDFDAQAVKDAIRGAQQGTVMYPQFKRLTRWAGCVGYTVWITGRHVSYYGRNGETHVEHFPD